jgi:histidine ammonia-lyase
VRLILLTKIGSLARGYSGVRPLIIDTLIALYNAGIMPAIPARARSAPRATWRRWRT